MANYRWPNEVCQRCGTTCTTQEGCTRQLLIKARRAERNVARAARHNAR